MEWINVNEELPESEKLVLITVKTIHGKPFVSTAAYVGYHERTMEDWGDYEGDTEYDEENDCYWVKPCWYEKNLVDDNPNWELSENEFFISHWMPLPKSADML